MTDNSSAAGAAPIQYAAKLYLISTEFEMLKATMGRPYAVAQLRVSLNHLSNEALQEIQRLREETPI